MYFYTAIDKKDQTQFTKLASFYIEKFPLAFGGRAIYSTSKGTTSEDEYVRIDSATSVDFVFEEKEHAQSFSSFKNKCL